ncbi:MAG: S-layer homology domain-containing protein [Acidobacteria bacterium]|nr:MAG: S-layer homology domain-containing protein [Acidobacteriota bacterium]
MGHWPGPWIERLAAEGITAGIGTGTYCPDAPVTRGQMAVFLTKTVAVGQ